jgi:trimethylamine corrinoid protein
MNEHELFARQRQAILDGRSDHAQDLAHEAVRSGVSLDDCIAQGYVAGIEEVGRLWEEGEYFLPELMQGAEAMKAAMSVLRPHMLDPRALDRRAPGRSALERNAPDRSSPGRRAPDRRADDRGGRSTGGGPTVVIGTVQGDIHDIGKTLVATFLEANGFRVIDLGRDVALDEFVDAASRDGADVICMSALLTTTMAGQGELIRMLEDRGVRERFKVLVGGAPVTRSFAESIGADGFAANAVDAVAEARRLAQVAS